MTKSPLRSFLSWAACLLFGLSFVAAAAARQKAGATIDVSTYAARLSQCADALAGLRGNPAEIPSFRQSLPAEWEVRAGDDTFRVSTASLDSALEKIAAHPAASAAEWREIQIRLDFLRQQAEEMESLSPGPSPAAARQKLDAIFRQREFRGLAGPGPLELWWRRLVDRIDQGIAWLIARLHLSALSGNVVAYVLIAIALVFLSLWGWRSLSVRMRQAQTVEENKPPASDGRMWASDALAAAQRGEFREAIHCAYWAAVARLEEQGVLSFNRSRTPRELLRLVASDAREQSPFRELTRSFELAWYGYRQPSPADWENAKIQLERIGCLGFSTPQTAGS